MEMDYLFILQIFYTQYVICKNPTIVRNQFSTFKMVLFQHFKVRKRERIKEKI